MEILNYTNNMNQFNYTQYLKENPLMRELSEDKSITAQTHDEGKRVKDVTLTVKVVGDSVIFNWNDKSAQAKISKEALKDELAKQDPTITIGGEKVSLYNSKPTLEKMVSGVNETDGEGSYKNPETMLEFGDATNLGPDEELMEEIDIEYETMEPLEQFRNKLEKIAATVQKSEDEQWIAAIRKIYNKLVDLENSIYDASKDLGVIPYEGLNETEGLSYPRADFSDAVYKALQAGLEKKELHTIVDFG